MQRTWVLVLFVPTHFTTLSTRRPFDRHDPNEQTKNKAIHSHQRAMTPRRNSLRAVDIRSRGVAMRKTIASLHAHDRYWRCDEDSNPFSKRFLLDRRRDSLSPRGIVVT
jgi:hypothetical protein